MLRSLRRAGRFIPIFFVSVLPFGVSLGQTPEYEPNDSCPGAQSLGLQTLPLEISGELSNPISIPDIDFISFIGPPNTWVQIDLQGVASGVGTLGDPFLGVLDGSCNVLASDDDGGFSTDSRLFLTTPPDGVLVLAASSCCDWELLGNGYSRGSYTILVDVPHVVGSISLRLVNAESGVPLVGWWPTNARAELWRCHDGGCDEPVVTQWADADGLIAFTLDGGGAPLQPGDYEVRGWAEGFEPAGSGPFTVEENEHLDLGDLSLTPYDLIGSISGQIVDSISGNGLPGPMAPWTVVQLLRCMDWGCGDYVGSTSADERGFFRFDYSNTWAPLLTGDYQIQASAEQYQTRVTLVAGVAKDEDRDIGRVRMRPFPVQFVEITPCDEIPAAGGSCQYSVVVRAGTRSRLEAEAWSIVTAWGTGSFLNSTTFQAGGTKSGLAIPEKFKLAPGELKRLDFRFEVQGSVQEGASICASAYVGQRPDAQYSTVGFRDLFCVTKHPDSFDLLPEKEMRKLLRHER